MGLAQREVVPAGISTKLAYHQHICSDCGLSYWNTSEYDEFGHVGCKGTFKKAGF